MAAGQASELSSEVFPAPSMPRGSRLGALLGYSVPTAVLVLGGCKHSFSSHLTVEATGGKQSARAFILQ